MSVERDTEVVKVRTEGGLVTRVHRMSRSGLELENEAPNADKVSDTIRLLTVDECKELTRAVKVLRVDVGDIVYRSGPGQSGTVIEALNCVAGRRARGSGVHGAGPATKHAAAARRATPLARARVSATLLGHLRLTLTALPLLFTFRYDTYTNLVSYITEQRILYEQKKYPKGLRRSGKFFHISMCNIKTFLLVKMAKRSQ